MPGAATVTQPLELEDTFVDIVGKARKGLHLSLEELAERSGLSVDAIQQVLDGEPDQHALLQLAHVLNLHGPSLVAQAQGQWKPKAAPTIDGLAMFTTWYGDMTVNAYVVWDPKKKVAASFDTGSSAQPMLDAINERQLTLSRIFITHTHMDHLADLDTLQSNAPDAHSYGSAAENSLGLKGLRHGDWLTLGDLRIRVLGTSGHTPGGLSYFIEGLERPLVVVGDALFAGSQGGAAYAYQEALTNNREKILSLPPETIICPGHGPLTTVGEERAHNPFFPELK